MSDIRFEGWLHRSGTGGVYQDSAGNVGIASTQPKTRLDIGNGGFQVGPTGIATVTTVNTTNLINATPLTNRNLIINGAMRIAQRATSSTANGYGDLDRWKHEYAGTDENPTFAQVSLTTSDTPYTLGLTKTAKITNGNQTSGLQASSLINFNQQIEAQNIRNSGWDYTSSSSYITLTFWVRASVEQNYHGFVKTQDGTNYVYPYETGTLSANTWTKITKSIPGNSNLTINDDTGGGFQVFPIFFGGTAYTSSSVTNNAWATWSSGGRSKDQTATWFTTNDATLEITGVQLEVGSVATPFEHRPVSDELARCKRYYEQFDSNGLAEAPFGVGYFEANNQLRAVVPIHEKRADVSFSSSAASTFSAMNTLNMPDGDSIALYKTGKKAVIIVLTLVSDVTSGDGRAGILCAEGSTEATLKFDAEI